MFICLKSEAYLLLLLVHENDKEHDTQQPTTAAEQVATLGCGTPLGTRLPVLLTGPAGPGIDNRQDWSTLMLRGSFYQPSTLALVSKTMVRSDFDMI